MKCRGASQARFPLGRTCNSSLRSKTQTIRAAGVLWDFRMAGAAGLETRQNFVAVCRTNLRIYLEIR